MPSRRPRRPLVVAAFVVLPFLVASFAIEVLRAGDDGPDGVVLVAVPHPDDEAQAWALLEREDDAYAVFVVMTHGEATNFCAPELPGFDAATGEAEPEPKPSGRNSESCAAARKNSMVAFLETAGEATGVVPAELGAAVAAGPFDAPPTVCRKDDSAECSVSDHRAEVLQGDGGAVVLFNLGDGDLTVEEVLWALETTVENREALGIEASLPVRSVISASYWNDGSFDGCVEYPHPDHRAVSDAVYDGGFGVDERAGATCASDDRSSVAHDISDRSWEPLFGTADDGTVAGAHPVHYGWLLDPYYPADETGQATLFHREQRYWVRSD